MPDSAQSRKLNLARKSPLFQAMKHQLTPFIHQNEPTVIKADLTPTQSFEDADMKNMTYNHMYEGEDGYLYMVSIDGENMRRVSISNPWFSKITLKRTLKSHYMKESDESFVRG